VQGRSCHTVSATNREFPAITVSAYDPAVPAAFSGALSTGQGNGIERLAGFSRTDMSNVNVDSAEKAYF
jgi:hypothetical protein